VLEAGRRAVAIAFIFEDGTHCRGPANSRHQPARSIARAMDA
jgi:hypothetical protein